MNTPILILLFNRPKETKILINRLRKIKPSQIYISQDGPRDQLSNDIVLCQKVKDIISEIDWDCKIKKKFNKVNLGCRTSVSSALHWLFENEKNGIILEDDCIPSKSFFHFCEQMLERYENSENIYSISGSNFQRNQKIGKGDYYFSKYAHCWGWATWKRAWKNYDDDMKFWTQLKNSNLWNELHPILLEKKYWSRIFDDVYKRKIDSWAYVWLASVWNAGGKSIIPNKNLIVNIGFNEFATNTLSYSKVDEKSLKFLELDNNISHPCEETINYDADQYVFKNHFNGKYNFWPWRFIYIIKILINEPLTFLLKIKKFYKK